MNRVIYCNYLSITKDKLFLRFRWLLSNDPIIIVIIIINAYEIVVLKFKY